MNIKKLFECRESILQNFGYVFNMCPWLKVSKEVT